MQQPVRIHGEDPEDVFDRDSIELWLKTNNELHPLTDVKFKKIPVKLIPANDVKQEIKNLLFSKLNRVIHEEILSALDIEKNYKPNSYQARKVKALKSKISTLKIEHDVTGKIIQFKQKLKNNLNNPLYSVFTKDTKEELIQNTFKEVVTSLQGEVKILSKRLEHIKQLPEKKRN